MLAARYAVFAILALSISATAQTRTLAVYPGDAGTLDSVSAQSLENELQRVLIPAGLEVSWRNSASPSDGAAVARLVVGAFDGNCSVSNPAGVARASADPAVFAETSVADNRVLPYFRVKCESVLRALAPILEPLRVPFRSEVFGRALGRVIAHEIYHILAQTVEHEDAGLAKPHLSRADLIVREFDLSPASLRRMRASFQSPVQAAQAGRAATPAQ